MTSREMSKRLFRKKGASEKLCLIEIMQIIMGILKLKRAINRDFFADSVVAINSIRLQLNCNVFRAKVSAIRTALLIVKDNNNFGKIYY